VKTKNYIKYKALYVKINLFQWSTDMTQSMMYGAKDVKLPASSNNNCFNPSNRSTDGWLLSRNRMVLLRTEPTFSCLQPASDTTRATFTHQTQHLHNWLVFTNCSQHRPSSPPAAHPQLQVYYSNTTITIKNCNMYQWILMRNFCRQCCHKYYLQNWLG